MQTVESFLAEWSTAERDGDSGTLGEAAIVTARNNTRGSYQGHPIPEASRATLVLVRDADHWQLAAIHMSFVAGTPGAPPLPGAGNN